MSDEYDAFGRKKDEGGLGDLGWGATGSPPAAPPPTTPAPTTTRPAPESRTVQTPAPPLIRRRRNPASALVRLLVLAGIAAAVYSTFAAGNHASDSARKAIDQFTQFDSGNGGGGGRTHRGDDDTVPKQVRARDYFTSAGLRAGLKILAREQPGRITNFSMRRDRIDVQVVRRGKTYIIDFPGDAEVPDVQTVSPGASTADSLSYEELSPSAPARLMRSADARLNRSRTDVDYFVASRSSDALQWGIYYAGGHPIALGESRGRYLRRIS